MKSMKNILTLCGVTLLLMILGTSTSFAGKPAGGGGGKVTVELATPNSVVQTAEEDVIIQGSGFDNGSTVRFLVTGTTDDSQFEVGPAQYLSPNELKVHIKTTGSTATVDYDIEVQTTSGRKGKGTTLFKVQQAEIACSEPDPKEPTIAYLTEFDTSGEVNTADIYLSNASGCEQTLLVDDAFQYLPDTKQNEGVNRFIKSVRHLRYAVRGNRGIVTWIDSYQDPWVQVGIDFVFDTNGSIYPDSGGPRQLYVSPEGHDILGSDVRINDQGEAVLVMMEYNLIDGLNDSPRVVSVYNADSGEYEVIIAGDCPIQDDTADCFVPRYGEIRWHPFGNEIYFSVENDFTLNDKKLIARIARADGVWLQPNLLIGLGPSDQGTQLGTVSAADLMTFLAESEITNKQGKIMGIGWGMYIIDIGECSEISCLPSDGVSFVTAERDPGVWTKDGS